MRGLVLSFSYGAAHKVLLGEGSVSHAENPPTYCTGSSKEPLDLNHDMQFHCSRAWFP